jgi:hypothetical protein
VEYRQGQEDREEARLAVTVLGRKTFVAAAKVVSKMEVVERVMAGQQVSS